MARGRTRVLSGELLELALQLYYQERLPVRKVADAIGVSHMTVWRELCRVAEG